MSDDFITLYFEPAADITADELAWLQAHAACLGFRVVMLRRFIDAITVGAARHVAVTPEAVVKTLDDAVHRECRGDKGHEVTSGFVSRAS